jgi:hypothetical protein
MTKYNQINIRKTNRNPATIHLNGMRSRIRVMKLP